MKKMTKGFTLVEVIVAMAILAIASLILVQVYFTVNAINRENHYINTSLSEQMKFVERYTNTEASPIPYAGDNTVGTEKRVNIGSGHVTLKDGTDEYYYGCDVFVLKSRKETGTLASTDKGYTEAGALRYKYLIGSN